MGCRAWDLGGATKPLFHVAGLIIAAESPCLASQPEFLPRVLKDSAIASKQLPKERVLFLGDSSMRRGLR